MPTKLSIRLLSVAVVLSACESTEPAEPGTEDTDGSSETDGGAETDPADTADTADSTDTDDDPGPSWSVGEPQELVRGASIAGAHGLAFDDAGNLLVASVAGAELVVLDPDSGEILDRIGAERGIQGPDDVALAPDGSLYATNFLTGTITRVGPDGAGSIIAEVGPGVNPVTVSDEGRVFVARCFLGDGLYEIDPTGQMPPRTIVESFGGGCGLNGFDIGPDGALYGPRFVAPEVVRVDVDTGDVTVAAEGFAVPNGVKFDPEGTMTVLDTAAGTIAALDPITGAREILATNLFGFDSHAFDADGRIFASALTEGQVFEVSPEGPIRPINEHGGMTQPGGIAVVRSADDTASLVVADWDVVRFFDGSTGEATGAVYSIIGQPGLPGSTTVALADGDLVFSSYFDNAIKLWDPETQQVLAERRDVAVPLDAIGYAGGAAVAELETGTIAWLELEEGGARELLADDMVVPTGLATDGDRLWASDWVTGLLMLVAEDGEALPEPIIIAELEHPEGLAVAPDGRILALEGPEPGHGRLVAVDPDDGAIEMLADDLPFGRPGPVGAPPHGAFNGVAVAPDGTVYVTGDVDNAIYRLDPA